MKNTLLSMALVSAGVLGALVGGGIQAHRDAKPAFDYESCTVIVAKGDLEYAPETPNWKEMVTTPGGNWCIRTRG